MPSASTLLIFLPTTSRSRSRRITSTSGSSGIVHALVQPLPCDTRRGLLGRLLRPPLAVAVRLAADEHRREEPLVVVGALVAHLVAGQLVDAARRQLLEPRLVVAAAGPCRLLADAGLERRQDH